jgi:hypothetical protein
MSQLKQLAEPFDPRLIEQKQGMDYVSHGPVTERVLATLGPYSQKVEQLIFTPDGKVDGALVTVTVEIDGRTVSVTEAGEGDNPRAKTNGALAKDAISDGVKRCWMRLGLGLHLWSGKHYVLDRVLERNESVAAHAEVLTTTTVEAQRALGKPVKPSKPRQETVVDSEPPTPTDAEVERSVEAQEAYEQLRQPESVAEQSKSHAPRKLTKAEAGRLHAKLGAIGYPQDKHYPLAAFRFKRDFTSLTELSIAESITLVDYAERQIKQRQAA